MVDCNIDANVMYKVSTVTSPIRYETLITASCLFASFSLLNNNSRNHIYNHIQFDLILLLIFSHHHLP